MSVKHWPQQADDTKDRIEKLESEKANLEAQVTDLQIALCDVYEMFAAATGIE